ncbi:MAG: trypsin-like peptidase domain-containing protein, partial [Ruminococcus sp.]|nr:trypsin-like peptidase domain-containing protein [Ruminococcus sp.]
MTNNPYEPYENIGTTPETPAEPIFEEKNITSSQNPESTEHIAAPDFTPDEYYQNNFANQSAQAENYARYGESFYSGEPTGPQNTYANPQPGYAPPQTQGYTSSYQNIYKAPKPPKKKKEKKPVTRGTIAAVLIVSILCSMVLGAGGGFLAANYFNNNSGTLNVSKSDGGSASYASSTSALSTTEIVEKTADSVVEITTEQVTTGSFSRQYIQQGAGSGVIISKDGYIITNYHVIEGASHLTVTLRDKTEYTDVEVVGTYEAGDIALLKIKAKEDLTFATFGDSTKISVGDYAVVIGNPLGQLGGS